jgi:hypothetical protein
MQKHPDETRMKRSVTLDLGEFAFKALAGEGDRGRDGISGRLERAIRCYLNDADADRPGWPYPRFLSRRDVGKIEVEFSIDADLWADFQAEAERQSVSARQLAHHAALYYAAELNAGRITERIIDDLEEPPGEAKS